MATDYPEARALALAAILPAGTDVYVALFLGNPIDGGAELTLTGYARAAFQNWTTADLGGESQRSNAAVLAFLEITGAGTADYWAIYDSPGGGVLLRSGMLLDGLGQPIIIVLSGAGDFVQFNIGGLRNKIVEV